MQQAVMTAPGQIEFQEVPRPVPGDRQVLLHIRHIGVCGSDIHVYHGLHPLYQLPGGAGPRGLGGRGGGGSRGDRLRPRRSGDVHAAGDVRGVLPVPPRPGPHLRVAQGDGLPDQRRGPGVFRHRRRQGAARARRDSPRSGGHDRAGLGRRACPRSRRERGREKGAGPGGGHDRQPDRPGCQGFRRGGRDDHGCQPLQAGQGPRVRLRICREYPRGRPRRGPGTRLRAG